MIFDFTEISASHQQMFEVKEEMDMATGSPWARSGSNGLPESFFGPSKPPPRRGYSEATMLTGRRASGRVLEDKGETLVIEFYATGDKETVNRGDVELSFRSQR